MTIVDGARLSHDDPEVVEAVLSVKEYNRFSKGIFSWVGFETKWLEYENRQRVTGETKWSFCASFLVFLGWHYCLFNGPLIHRFGDGIPSMPLAIGLIGFFVAKNLDLGRSCRRISFIGMHCALYWRGTAFALVSSVNIWQKPIWRRRAPNLYH